MSTVRTTRSLLGVVAVSMLLTMTACTEAGSADKAGSDVVVLRLATIDDVNSSGQAYGPEAFVHALSVVSGGGLRGEIVKNYGEGEATAESELVEAIATGDVDGGWPSTRAFARAGIGGLESVEAPMILT